MTSPLSQRRIVPGKCPRMIPQSQRGDFSHPGGFESAYIGSRAIARWFMRIASASGRMEEIDMNIPCAMGLHGLSPRRHSTCLALALAISAALAQTASGGQSAVGISSAGIPNAAAHPRTVGGGRRPVPTLAVDNCNDDGAGSLRAAVAAAASGDLIDLTALACSTITLTTGFIGVTQDDLSLTGPGAGVLAIDAGSNSSVIRHTGTGTLTISGLAISNGNYQSTDTPRGGCLYSAADLSLVDSTVSYCTAVGMGSAIVHGGGVYTSGDLSLVGSTVTMSQAHGNASAARGGGV
jgi:hypothetical protein